MFVFVGVKLRFHFTLAKLEQLAISLEDKCINVKTFQGAKFVMKSLFQLNVLQIY